MYGLAEARRRRVVPAEQKPLQLTQNCLEIATLEFWLLCRPFVVFQGRFEDCFVRPGSLAFAVFGLFLDQGYQSAINDPPPLQRR